MSTLRPARRSRNIRRSATAICGTRSTAPTARTGNGRKLTTVAERAALVRRVGELHSERRKELADIIVAEMGKPVGQARGEVDFSASIYEFYADNAESLMADEPIGLSEGEGSAVIRRSSLGALLGIMPWNFPYYQVARFAGPNLIIGNTILLKHAPQCPQSAEAMAQIYADAGFPDGRLREHLRDERADRVGDRRPARPRRLRHRLRACRRRRRGDRRPEPEEGRARARRLRPVHRPRHRRPRQDGRGRGRREDRQRGPVVQRREADDRDRRALRAVPREVHGGAHRREAGRSARARDRDRTAVLPGRGRPPRGSGQARGRAGRDGRRRRQAERQLLRADGADRRHPGERHLPRRAVRPGRAGLSRAVGGRGDHARKRHAVRARLVRDDDRPGRRPSVSPTRSTPAWST